MSLTTVKGKVIPLEKQVNWVTPEQFGAVGNGIADDTFAWQLAINSGKSIIAKSSSSYVLNNTLIFPYNHPNQTIDGNGCIIIWNQLNKQIFDQYDISNSVIGWTSNVDYRNINFKGLVKTTSLWSNVGLCFAICYANGFAENLTFDGFTNCFRVFGNTITTNIKADNLRNGVWSERNNNNHISNVECGWCAGDVLVFYSQHSSASNITAEYAGVIPTNTEEPATAPRGCLISTGQDGYSTQCKYIRISDVSCKWHGSAGIVCSGEHITVSGALNVGSLYLPSKQASSRGMGIWIGGTNIHIGDVNMISVETALVVQSGSSNCTIGELYISGQLVGTQRALISAYDDLVSIPNQLISNVYIQKIIMDGYVDIGNVVVLSTDGINLNSLFIRSIGNATATRTILVKGSCKIGNIKAFNPGGSSGNATFLEFSGNAQIDRLELDGLYGTCILINSGSIPKIGDVVLRNLGNGGVSPIIINGVGTENHFWGTVQMNGNTTVLPSLIGTLTLSGYYSPAVWKSGDATKTAVVKYPTLNSTTLSP